MNSALCDRQAVFAGQTMRPPILLVRRARFGESPVSFPARQPADAPRFPSPSPGGSRPAPARRERGGGGWRVALALTAGIFALLLGENRQYLFATKLYESSDWASDSLLVREAEHTFLLHGHYSQWRFYHPGPALLDTLAAGEALFYDAWRLVPTPYNGQLLALCLVMTLFFSVALSVFARQLGRDRGGYLFFLPLALVFAVCHYGAVGGQIFLDAWPAYPLVLTFLCFVVAAAATAAGGGRELPALVVTGGWLVHNHVAQPLFVVPLTLLAYAGLLAACWRLPGGPRGLTAAWRAFPQAHGIAAALLGLFVLPLGLDALRGADSNLARILEYLRAPHEGKKFLRSLCYFLTFGAYDAYGAYQPGHRVFGPYSASGMLAFAGLHWRAYALWIAALLGTPALFFVAGKSPEKHDQNEPRQTRVSFLLWFYVILAAAWALTLVWGMRQDGPMYYYNAYFDYSIYFGVALGFAAALATALTAWTRSPAARRMRPVIGALLWTGVAAALFLRADRFRVAAFGTPADAAMARTVARAAATLPANAVCFVDCRPWENWQAAVAVVLELERLGRKVGVNDNWEIIFGRQQSIQREKLDAASPLVRWMVVSQSDAPAGPGESPLRYGCDLKVKTLPDVNPAGQRIDFSPDGNYDDFAFYGWSPADAVSSWSDQRTALLVFRPLPLPEGAAGVDLLISACTAPPPGKTDRQRAVIRFNDAPPDTVDLPLCGPQAQPWQLRVSAAWWQDAVRRGEARLQFRFPDARSPASLGLGADHRLLGGNFRGLEFRPASETLTVERTEGWYEPETDGNRQWCWTNGRSVLSVSAPRAGTLVLEGDVDGSFPGNAVEILVNDKPIITSPLPDAGWQSATWRVPVPAGRSRVTLRSRLPAVQPPGDSRQLAFRMRDLRGRLEP